MTMRFRDFTGCPMKHEPAVVECPEADAAADAGAKANVREGRLIGHSAMTRRLRSWGSGKRLAKPTAGD